MLPAPSLGFWLAIKLQGSRGGSGGVQDGFGLEKRLENQGKEGDGRLLCTIGMYFRQVGVSGFPLGQGLGGRGLETQGRQGFLEGVPKPE